MPISSAISAVVTFGSPRRLNIARLVSTIRSRVRRGRLRSAMTIGCGRRKLAWGDEPGVELVQRVGQVASRLVHTGLARLERASIDQRGTNGPLVVGQNLDLQADAVSREQRLQHCAARK